MEIGEEDNYEAVTNEYNSLIFRREYSSAYQLFQREKQKIILNLPVHEILISYILFKTKLGDKEAEDFREKSVKTLEDSFDNLNLKEIGITD